MVDFTSDTLLGDIRRCILKKKMDLGNIGGFRVPKKALFSGFQPFFGHFKGPEWCQTKIQGHATPAERSPMIAERICGFWFQGSFVQIVAHCALMVKGRWPPIRSRLLFSGYMLIAFITRELFRMLIVEMVNENIGSHGRDRVRVL